MGDVAHMGVSFRVATALLASCALAGCGVYLHDERLVTPATNAEASLTSASTTAPFDAQLALLSAFAQEEDLSVARYRVAERDKQLSRLVAGNFTAPALVDVVAGRLKVLAPAAIDKPDLLAKINADEIDRGRILEDNAQSERLAARERENYLSTVARLKLPDAEARATKSGCKDVKVAVSSSRVDQTIASPNEADRALGHLAKQCWVIDGQLAKVAEIDARVQSVGGLIADIAKGLAEAQAQTEPDLSSVAIDLQTQIKKAEEAAKKAEAESLNGIRDDIEQVLDGVGQAARLAGWEKVDGAIGKLLRAQVCTAPKESVDADKLTQAECDKVEPSSTTGKAAATWAFAEALSQLLQSNDKNLRTTQWLLAAKAIVAAEKANAKLQLAQAKATATAQRARLSAHLEELTSLTYARTAIASGSSPGCTGSPNSCAFAAYVLSWNRGRVPGEVLEYRPIQVDREYAVRRAKAVAEKQRALALVGASTLKAGADGGLKPELIAQLLLDLTLIGVTAEK